MADWIKMRPDLYRHPKVIMIADFLMDQDGELARFVNQNLQRDMSVTRNVMRNVTVGALVSVWGVTRHRGKRDGDDLILEGAPHSVIDDIADLPGFGRAMIDAGWVKESSQGLVFPRFFDEHNVDPMEAQRAKNRERQRRHRAKNLSRDSNVTVTSPSRTEKEREKERESNNPPTPLRGKKPVTVDDIEFPKGMDTPEVREAMSEWLQYKRDRGQAYKKPRYPQKLINERMMSGPKAFVAAVNFSISNNYAGLFNAQTDSTGMADSAAEGGSRAERRQQSNAAALEAFLREGDGDAVRDEANGRIHGGGTEGVARRPGGLPPPDD